MSHREGASHFGSQTSSVKAKGKKDKAKGKRARNQFLPFNFCLLPFAFTEAMALRPGITSGVPLSVKRPRRLLRAGRGFRRVWLQFGKWIAITVSKSNSDADYKLCQPRQVKDRRIDRLSTVARLHEFC